MGGVGGLGGGSINWAKNCPNVSPLPQKHSTHGLRFALEDDFGRGRLGVRTSTLDALGISNHPSVLGPYSA